MARITMSAEAMAAIRKKHAEALSMGKVGDSSTVVPLLAWSHRSYLTFADGQTVECGPRFILSYRELDEIAEPVVVTVDGEQVVVRPARKFETGSHRIGFENGDFTLESEGA